MRDITKEMICYYKLKKLGFDFMGYYITKNKCELSFHHFLIPKFECKMNDLGEGYYIWNGVILRQKTAHEYIHIIERYDLDRFDSITSELLDQKIKGYIDLDNIIRINDILDSFEREYINKTTNEGHYIIQERYFNRTLKKKMLK